jgi:hypothetical protein
MRELQTFASADQRPSPRRIARRKSRGRTDEHDALAEPMRRSPAFTLALALLALMARSSISSASASPPPAPSATGTLAPTSAFVPACSGDVSQLGAAVVEGGDTIVGLSVTEGQIFVQFIDGTTSPPSPSAGGGIDQFTTTGAFVARIFAETTDEGIALNPPIAVSNGYVVAQSGLGYEPVEECSISSCAFSKVANQGADVASWVVGGGALAIAYVNDIPAVSIQTLGSATGARITGPTFSSYPRGPVATDGNDFVYVDAPGAVTSCTVASGCASPITITASLPDLVNVFEGVIYLSTTGPDVDTVTTCPADGACTPSPYLTTPSHMSQTAVDSSGFYWLDVNGTVWTAPLYAPAPVSPVQVATGVSLFAVEGDGFVYYVGTGANNGTVYQVPNPSLWPSE